MKIFTSKVINMNIKKGWSEKDFAEYYEISEEEFLKKMRKTFSKRGVEEMLSEMKKNRKKVNGKKALENVEAVVETNEAIEMTGVTETTEVIEENETLQKLKVKEANLSDALCEEENFHKNLVTSRREKYDSLRRYRSKLVRLQSELQDCMYSVIEIDENISKINEEMEKSNANKASLKEQLENIRAEIEAYSKVNIFAYEDGNIEIDGETEIPAEWSTFATTLTANEQLEFLTVRQIKQLAKLVVLTFDLEKRGVKYDLVFDSEIVQQLFEQFK